MKQSLLVRVIRDDDSIGPFTTTLCLSVDGDFYSSYFCLLDKSVLFPLV